MRFARLATIALLVLIVGCGKSNKLAALLPDAPEGWKIEGSNTNNDVSGVGHSSARSYVPAGGSSGVQRVTVQILLAEKGADQNKLQAMALEKQAFFKERKEVRGFPAYETFPLPDNDVHSLDIIPKTGAWVVVIAYKGGPGWEKQENRRAAVSAFTAKLDLKKIAAFE